MSIRSLRRDSPALDKVFIYFMRTILHLERTGVEHLPLENPLEEPWRGFLDKSMAIFSSCCSPELARLLLDTERDVFLSQGSLTAETALGMEVIREMAWQLRYNQDVYEYLLRTENLWGQDALQYAALTFYPNLPEEARKKHGIDNPIETLRPELLRLSDY